MFGEEEGHPPILSCQTPMLQVQSVCFYSCELFGGFMYYCYALTHTYYNFFPSSHAGATTTPPPHTYCVGESEEDNEDAAKLAKH